MTTIRHLIWDAANVVHIARHEVIPDEVEEVCHGRPFTSRTYKSRLRLIGPTKTGRMITVIVAPKGKGSYQVVTARSASRKERKRWKKAQKGGETE